jgi:WD40 repeat protein
MKSRVIVKAGVSTWTSLTNELNLMADFCEGGNMSKKNQFARKWWLLGITLAIVAVLTAGVYFGGWLDVLLGDNDALGLVEVGSPVQSVAFSPDGTLIAAGSSDGTARLWQVDESGVIDQSLLHTLAIPPEGRETSYSHDVAFSPGGATLAFGLPDGTVQLWRVADGTLLRTLRGDTGKICSLAFSPDGRILAAGDWNGRVVLWQVADGTVLETLEEHTNGVVDLAFSPDGTKLASVSLDCTTKVWGVTSGTLIHEMESSSVQTGVSFSPDGSLLAVDRQLWSVDDWQPRREMNDSRGGMGNVVFSPDGDLLAAGNAWYEVRWWRVTDGSLLHVAEGHTDSVNSVAFSPDGELLASGSLDGTVRLWRGPQ